MKIITPGHFDLSLGYERIKFLEAGFVESSEYKLIVLKQIIDQENKKKRKIKHVGRKIGRAEFNIDQWNDLETEWWQELNSCLNPIKLTHGTTGEEILLLSLLQMKLKDHLCIPRLMVGRNLEVDLVIIGPQGVWVIESKYISGEILLRNGVWSREKKYFSSGKHQKTVVEDLGDIDGQWLRNKEEVKKTLQISLPELLDMHPNLIRGGIAFTHEKCRGIDVDSSSMAEWGNITIWKGAIFKPRNAKGRPVKPFLSQEQIIAIADALLAKSIDFQVGQKRSTIITAENVWNRRARKLYGLFFTNKELFFEISGWKPDCAFLEADSLDQAIDDEVDQAIDELLVQAIINIQN